MNPLLITMQQQRWVGTCLHLHLVIILDKSGGKHFSYLQESWVTWSLLQLLCRSINPLPLLILKRRGGRCTVVGRGEAAALQCNRSNLPPPPLPPLCLQSLIDSAVQQLVSKPCWTLQQPDVTAVVSRNHTHTFLLSFTHTSSPSCSPLCLLAPRWDVVCICGTHVSVSICLCVFMCVEFHHQVFSGCEVAFVCVFPDDGSHFLGFALYDFSSWRKLLKQTTTDTKFWEAASLKEQNVPLPRKRKRRESNAFNWEWCEVNEGKKGLFHHEEQPTRRNEEPFLFTESLSAEKLKTKVMEFCLVVWLTVDGFKKDRTKHMST